MHSLSTFVAISLHFPVQRETSVFPEADACTRSQRHASCTGTANEEVDNDDSDNKDLGELLEDVDIVAQASPLAADVPENQVHLPATWLHACTWACILCIITSE